MTSGRLLTAICAGATLLMTAAPAFASLHRSDIGTGIVRLPVNSASSAMLPGAVSAVQYSAASNCTWHRQKFWDGYSWRVQRSQICE